MVTIISCLLYVRKESTSVDHYSGANQISRWNRGKNPKKSVCQSSLCKKEGMTVHIKILTDCVKTYNTADCFNELEVSISKSEVECPTMAHRTPESQIYPTRPSCPANFCSFVRRQ